MNSKKTEITVETREIWRIRRQRLPTWAWCGDCEKRVELVTPEEAAQLTSGSLRQIFRQIEQAQLHFMETPSGNVWVCAASLTVTPPALALADGADGADGAVTCPCALPESEVHG